MNKPTAARPGQSSSGEVGDVLPRADFLFLSVGIAIAEVGCCKYGANMNPKELSASKAYVSASESISS
jgi:hypothetical protein